VYIFGDEDQIKQILINLLVNAFEAINKDLGEVTISIDSDKHGKAIVRISDDGPGIDDNTISNIFNPFYSTKQYGTGLGLSIVQRLAGNLDIDLSCKSTVGEGTVFTLKFNQKPNMKKIDTEKEAVTA